MSRWDAVVSTRSQLHVPDSHRPGNVAGEQIELPVRVSRARRLLGSASLLACLLKPRPHRVEKCLMRGAVGRMQFVERARLLFEAAGEIVLMFKVIHDG